MFDSVLIVARNHDHGKDIFAESYESLYQVLICAIYSPDGDRDLVRIHLTFVWFGFEKIVTIGNESIPKRNGLCSIIIRMANDIQFSEWLYEQMQGKWSQADLARAAGIRPSTVNKMLNSKGKRPDSESLCGIADALGISRITVFQAAKILLPEPEFPEKHDFLMIVAQLPTQERLKMLAFAKILLEFTKESHSEA